MKNIANLLFEAKMLKEIPRSGFHFLGSGKESIADIGYAPPDKWLPPVRRRLKTETAKKIAQSIMQTSRDDWWFNNYVDTD